MTVPPEFSETEHLQNLIRRYINKAVREDFSDLGGDDWNPDLTTTRGAMRYGLTHKDNDPFQLTLARMFLYYFTYGKAAAMQPAIYGTPTTHFDSYSLYKPQIHLYFRQDISTVNEGENSVKGEVTFRLINETTTGISNTEVDRYALKISNSFAKPTKFVWKKGKHRFTYTDDEKGYRLQLNVISEAEGKRVTEQILDIQDHTPDWKYAKYLQTLKPTDKYPNIPGTQTILGKIQKKVKRRAQEDVKFRRASLLIHGLPSPITLVDTTGLRRNARIYA